MSHVKVAFRALASRNYRLFMVGYGISLVGTWVQQTALSWLVYRLTNSAAILGLVGFCSQIPSFVVAPLAGVLVDRVNKHRLVILTQTLAMLQATLLGALFMTHTLEVWHIPLLSLALGVVNAFDIPARQSFVIDMVGEIELLGSAIALNSTMVNMARIVGPTIAGTLIAIVGEGACFYINGASYIAVIASLLCMKNIRTRRSFTQEPVLKGFREGVSYTFGSSPIRMLLLHLGMISLTGASYGVVLPIFARDIFHGGPHTLGYLLGASGAGALCGAAFLASRRRVAGLETVILYVSFLFGVSLILFSRSPLLALSMFMLLFSGFGMMVLMAASNTILQTIVDDDKRGRVMSFFTVAFIGMSPFGNLLAGLLASHFGAQSAVMATGSFCLIASLFFTINFSRFKKLIAPIYERKGVFSPEKGRGLP